jgi:CRISPR locus-related DNA-binding protein
MNQNLRIHICPVGFEVKRVVDPLVSMRADKVYLITYKKGDEAQSYLEKIESELKNYPNIELVKKYVNIWDLFQCLELMREIISTEYGNNIFVNVSTGTKITAIAGMLSCMLWGPSPYYARVSYPPSNKTMPNVTEFVETPPDTLPVYGINKPKPEYLLILKLLKDNGSKLRKSRLIELLEDGGIIKKRSEIDRGFSASAKHSQLRVLLDPMIRDWNYIKIMYEGRRPTVNLTEQGVNALRIFGTG